MASITRAGWLVGLTTVSLISIGCASETESTTLVIGLVTNNSNGMRNIEGFREEMGELGYVEGVDVVYRYAGEPLSDDRLESELQAMVEAEVDLIFTAGTPTGVAAKRATEGTEIPVVFGVIADPIRAGVMDDLTEPGGNMTGVKLEEDQSRRLLLLLELVPSVERILVPFNSADPAAVSAVEQIDAVAGGMGVELDLRAVPSHEAISVLLDDLPETVDAVFLVPDTLVNSRLSEITAGAIARRLPTSGPSVAQVEGGALMAYGFDNHIVGAQAARIARQVLTGLDPGSIPVENTESVLAINLATAHDLGLEISDELLRQATIVIRHDESG